MTSHPTAATLRLHSKAPFVLPFGVVSGQLYVSSTGDAASVFGWAGTSSYDTTLMGINSTATVGADARVKTMQDRPPRGAPR